MATKTVQDYERDVRKYHEAVSEYPDNENLQNKLKYRLSKWSSLLDIQIHIAKNEGTPWQESEIGYPCIPMLKKATSKQAQVGDYQTYLKDYDVWLPILIERKTCEDWYGTLMNRSNRLRFKREIEKFRQDPRFNLMIVIVEGTKNDFLTYIPSVYVASLGGHIVTQQKNLIKFFKRYYKMDFDKVVENGCGFVCEGIDHKATITLRSTNEAELRIDGGLNEILTIKPLYGKQALYLNRGASIESRRASAAKIIIEDIYVEWAGSREEAIKTYLQYIRQGCIHNYERILRLKQ